MSMVAWAFNQDLPTAEKLVLVWIAHNASCNGVAPQYRGHLASDTGYKKRSMQRLIRSLKDSGHIEESGDYFVIGPKDPVRDIGIESAASLPAPMLRITASEEVEIINTGDSEAIAQTVGDYVIDQLANFEQRMLQEIKRAVLFHVEQEKEPEPASDPVITNPLFQELIDLGKSTDAAYALSEADLAMDADQAGVIDRLPLDVQVDSDDDGYGDHQTGRFTRIADILHGSDAGEFIDQDMMRTWNNLEMQENRHTVKGEADAFELIYPAIVLAAKANVGKMQLAEFVDPARALAGDAPWDKELNPVDKDDPNLMIEISTMIAELEEANDPRCQVQPRTTETSDDGETRTETVLGFHRRVSAKHREMQKLRLMGVI